MGTSTLLMTKLSRTGVTRNPGIPCRAINADKIIAQMIGTRDTRINEESLKRRHLPMRESLMVEDGVVD